MSKLIKNQSKQLSESKIKFDKYHYNGYSGYGWFDGVTTRILWQCYYKNIELRMTSKLAKTFFDEEDIIISLK